jgi:hypothetical protein
MPDRHGTQYLQVHYYIADDSSLISCTQYLQVLNLSEDFSNDATKQGVDFVNELACAVKSLLRTIM